MDPIWGWPKAKAKAGWEEVWEEAWEEVWEEVWEVLAILICRWIFIQILMGLQSRPQAVCCHQSIHKDEQEPPLIFQRASNAFLKGIFR